MSRSYAAVSAAALVCAVALAACGGSSESSSGKASSSGSSGTKASSKASEPKSPVKIGFAMGFTGGTNAFDGPVFGGAQVAIDEINAKGGIDGRKLEILKGDTRSDIPSVESAALDVLDQGAQIVVTSCDYDFGGPSARAANQQGKLAIGCAGDPLYGKQGIGPLTFNTLSTTPSEAGVIAALAQKKGWKRAYILADTTIQYSKRGCQYVEQALKATGIAIAGKNTFQNGDNSIAPQVSRIGPSGADFIALCSYLPGVTSAVRQIRSAGIEIPIAGQAGVDGGLIAGGVPHLSELYYPNYGSVHGGSPNPLLNRLGREYDALTDVPSLKETQDYAPILGYASIQTVAKAIEQTGSTDGATLAKAIEGFTDVELVSGKTSYSSQCHTPIERPWVVSMVKDGKVSVVDAALKPINLPKAPC